MAKTDFDKDKLAQDTEQHGKDISGLDERVSSLEEKLKPEQISFVLEEASKDSKKLDVLFSKLFCYMMEKDEKVKKAVSEHIKKSDRSAVFSMLKKWGGFVGGGILYILGLLTKMAVDYFLN